MHNGELFPTVFFLWKYPDCILYFTMENIAMNKLKAGANVILPGMCSKQVDFSDTISLLGDMCVYVNTVSNKSAIAVGKTMSNNIQCHEEEYNGTYVIIHHVVGDYLCQFNDLKGQPKPEMGMPTAFPILSQDCLLVVRSIQGSAVLDAKVKMGSLILHFILINLKYSTMKMSIQLSTFCNSYMKLSYNKYCKEQLWKINFLLW
ncbi:hypothetical protein RI129_011516 [Pyrocoelia pectoralis]|uniref:Eukaryotic translation initiation factor 2D-like PUA RNA-binding domain-containing protein n=1 Tax=Pyrocoelia pectoralis TaxID=417401 RepID=A0AAN7V2U8_9COLE